MRELGWPELDSSGKPPLAKRPQATARLGQHQLHVADASFREASLAVREVESPHALKALVVSEPAQRGSVGQELLAPPPQRGDIACGDVLEVDQLQVGP